MFNWYQGSDPNKPPEPVRAPPPDPRAGMLKWFAFGHLPPPLQAVSIPFNALAVWMMENLPPGAEATDAMRQLLRAKDSAVRSALDKSN
jgi:hypothetical protein